MFFEVVGVFGKIVSILAIVKERLLISGINGIIYFRAPMDPDRTEFVSAPMMWIKKYG
jgi:hypothetical protein